SSPHLVNPGNEPRATFPSAFFKACSAAQALQQAQLQGRLGELLRLALGARGHRQLGQETSRMMSDSELRRKKEIELAGLRCRAGRGPALVFRLATRCGSIIRFRAGERLCPSDHEGSTA